ncbi:MAG: hypothetical protein ACI9YU_002292 [Flavobacteriales bacterium]|jgi:hypothetical protein
MKKYFAIAVFAIGTMSLTSCSSDCCTVTSTGIDVEVCEDTYDDAGTGISWGDYKTLVAATSIGSCG